MATTYTSDELIAAVKRRARLPGTEADGTANSDILAVLNEAIDEELVPFILNLREDYYTLTETQSLTSGNPRYRVPKRAWGNKLREVKYRPDTGTDPTNDIDLARIPREFLENYSYRYGSNTPVGFYMENVDIVLVPENISATGSLVISYAFRPSDLVLVSSGRKVTAVDTTTRTVTLDSAVPSSWSTSNLFDVHSTDSGAEIRVWSASATTVLGQSMVFSSSNPIDGSTTGTKAVQVGDYVCLEGESVVPAIPKDLHPLLVRVAAAMILEDQGDLEAAAYQRRLIALLKKQLEDALVDRVEGEGFTAVRPNSVWFGGGRLYEGVWR